MKEPPVSEVFIVDRTRLELVASPVSGERSSQLS